MMTNEELKKIIVSDAFYKYRDQFIKSINKDPFFKYVCPKNSPEKSPVEFDINNFDLFKAAVEQGYNDAKRTFTGIGEKWGKTLDKEDFFESLAREIQKVFLEKEPKEFDDWHKETCDLFISKLKEHYPATYGQAQKVINMAFKYLYCLKEADAKEYKIIFDKCHMPLDSYTLEWIFQELYPQYTFKGMNILLISSNTNEGEKFYKKYTPSWSNLNLPMNAENALDEDNNYSYVLIKNLVNFHLKDIPPLKAEFVIWPEIQMKLVTKEFISALKKFNNRDIIKSKLKKVETEIDEFLDQKTGNVSQKKNG